MVSTRNRKAETDSPLRTGLVPKTRNRITRTAARKTASAASEDDAQTTTSDANAAAAASSSKPATRAARKKAAPAKAAPKKAARSKRATRPAAATEQQDELVETTQDEDVSASPDVIEIQDDEEQHSEDTTPAPEENGNIEAKVVTPAASPIAPVLPTPPAPEASPVVPLLSTPERIVQFEEALRLPSHSIPQPATPYVDAASFTSTQLTSVATPRLPAPVEVFARPENTSSSSASSANRSSQLQGILGRFQPLQDSSPLSEISGNTPLRPDSFLSPEPAVVKSPESSSLFLVRSFINSIPAPVYSPLRRASKLLGSDRLGQQKSTTSGTSRPATTRVRLNGSSSKNTPYFSHAVRTLAEQNPSISTVKLSLWPFTPESSNPVQEVSTLIDMASLQQMADFWDRNHGKKFDTDRAGSKRKRNNAESEPEEEPEPEVAAPSPAKRARTLPGRTPPARGAYYDDEGNIQLAGLGGMDSPATVDADRNCEKREREQAEQQAHDLAQQRRADAEAEAVVKQAENEGKEVAIVAPSPKQAATGTPTRGWGFSSISGLFKSPIGFLRRSATPARNPIPDFTAPQPTDNNPSTSPTEASSRVARPLFTQKSPRKKKVTKAKRQEAIAHQDDLLQREDEMERRRAATEAIIASARSAEDVEAEIKRRVEEELATRNLQKTPPKKRKRAASAINDGPGHTPHSKKVNAKRSLAQTSQSVEAPTQEPVTPPHPPPKMTTSPYKTPDLNRSFGLDYDDSDGDEGDERPAKRAKKSVQFNPRQVSMTTPPDGSDLARIQARRPPGSTWRAGDMFKDGPIRGVLKDTGYVPPVDLNSPGYYINRLDDWATPPLPEPREKVSTPVRQTPDGQEKKVRPPTSHSKELGIPKEKFNFTGSFTPLDYSSSDESDGESENTLGSPGFTPVAPKKSTNMFESPAAQPETPPAAPQPAHATLPAGAQSATPNKPDSPNLLLAGARAKATQFTPKQPSRLRESTNAATSPEPVIDLPAFNIRNIEGVDLAVLAEIDNYANPFKVGQQNFDAATLTGAEKPEDDDQEVHLLATMATIEDSNVDKAVSDEINTFWSTVSTGVVSEMRAGLGGWAQTQGAEVTV